MPRSTRAKPRDLVPEWPDGPSADPIAEVARRFAVNLKKVGGSARSIARASGVHQSTVLGILDGVKWPDLETIAKIELGVQTDLWPGRVK
jgi:lambda repressor-like predicted transcriptional regulator